MTKSFYIILTAVAVFVVLFLMGQWIGRSYSLTKGLLARQVYEAFCHTTEQYDADRTKEFPALFREELNKRELDKLVFRMDTVSLSDPETVLRKDIRYFSDYEQLFNERHTFVYPINDTQGVQAHIINPRAGSIGRLLYYFFGTAIALIILLIGIQKQINIIKRQDEVARMREDFSYAMIHDMKTPLSSILMGARILRSGKLDDKPEKKEKFFDILEKETEHLLALTNKVLTISKLEHGQLLLEKSWIPIRPMIEELTQMFAAKTSKPVTFNLNIEAEEIFADEEYLKEAVSNLIDNAIKYSHGEAEVTIHCRKVTVEGQNEQTEISVSDHGIGIAPEKQKHIFDKFYRVPTGNLHDVKGYGLGLFYVKTMIEKHGGSVSVKRELGKGSTFTIRI